LFQGRLVARTFLEHIHATLTVEDEHRIPKRPVGALIMSIQAVCTGFTWISLMLTSHVQVHRVLLYSIEGTFKPPRAKSGAFSKVNWGDYEAVESSHQRTRSITVKRATVFLNRIQTLKDQQWDDIYKTALENNERIKRINSGECISEEDNSADESDDDELLDPLYDEIGEYA
jgi:hypothetical protein